MTTPDDPARAPSLARLARAERARRRLAEAAERTSSGRVALSVVRGLVERRAARVASAAAYDLFLAGLPLLAVTGWLLHFGLRADREAVAALAQLLRLAPADVSAIAIDGLGRFAGAVAPFAALGGLWLASSAFHTLLDVLERTGPSHARTWAGKRALSVTCVAAATVVLAAAGALVVAVQGGPARAILRLLGPGPGVGAASATASLTLAAAFAVASLAAFFRIAVRRPGVRRVVWPGALATVALAGLGSAGLTAFAGSVATYALFYGTLSAVAIVLVWSWLMCIALLVGAELNAALERAPTARAEAAAQAPPSPPPPTQIPQPSGRLESP
ncbi:MAG: YihY/virulence factor BrkB family protein [Polyangiaceae bacterium]|nr:YihY/virulence factor BrkB family protein [Polyangiaceae bacterium]